MTQCLIIYLCESKEPIPLACGAPCQTKCMQLPVANDSVEHCEQIKPIDISPDGTFPVAVVATESSSSVDRHHHQPQYLPLSQELIDCFPTKTTLLPFLLLYPFLHLLKLQLPPPPPPLQTVVKTTVTHGK